MNCSYIFFFFQAEDGIRDYKVTGVQTCVFFKEEDGIRDYKVTGVQTCALPICRRGLSRGVPGLDAPRPRLGALVRGRGLRRRRDGSGKARPPGAPGPSSGRVAGDRKSVV